MTQQQASRSHGFSAIRIPVRHCLHAQVHSYGDLAHLLSHLVLGATDKILNRMKNLHCAMPSTCWPPSSPFPLAHLLSPIRLAGCIFVFDSTCASFLPIGIMLTFSSVISVAIDSTFNGHTKSVYMYTTTNWRPAYAFSSSTSMTCSHSVADIDCPAACYVFKPGSRRIVQSQWSGPRSRGAFTFECPRQTPPK